MATLKSIKSSAFSRGLALAKVSVAASAKVAGHAMGGLFGDSSEEASADRFKQMMTSQMSMLSRELGKLKGSVMKVGQMLSMYGEHLLPPEANQMLKSLQSESPPLAWSEIEKVLRRQLGPEKLALLEVETEPCGSASLGQVHRAREKATGRLLAIKVQYPGVDHAISSDLKALRSVLQVSKLIPKGPKYDELFHEVQEMLHQEVDYAAEKKQTNEFRALFSNDPRIVIPETLEEFSTRRVLVTSFEEGVSLESPEVLALPQERRNAIGRLFLEVYFRELLEFGRLQTDPHFGNYRIRLGATAAEDRLICLDYGAVREFAPEFLRPYFVMLRGAAYQNRAEVERGAADLGFLQEGDPEDLLKKFYDLCILFTEPFGAQNQPYDWGASDLPKRVIQAGSEIAWGFRLRVPPRETVFLDRKMGGVFVVLSVLKVKADCRDLLEKYLSRTPF